MTDEAPQPKAPQPTADQSDEPRPQHPGRTAWWSSRRDRLRQRPLLDFSYRVLLAVVGVTVLLVGAAAIPYPGPGWAIVFLGLAILASEFYWAKKTLTYTRDRYTTAMEWLGRQPAWVQALTATLTAAIVVTTMWFLGAVYWGAALVGLEHPLLRSPIGLGGL